MLKLDSGRGSPSFTSSFLKNKPPNSIRVLTFEPILFWFEKFNLILDWFQIFSLLWITSQPWGLPFIFSVYSRPILYVNVDLFSLTSKGAILGRSSLSTSTISLWGEMDNYLNYALAFAIAQFLLFGLVPIFKMSRHWNLFDYGGFIDRNVDHLIFISLYLSQFLYLPCALAVFRLFYCDSQSNLLSADPTVTCGSGQHIFYVILCTCLSMSAFIGLPLLLIRSINKNLIYRSRTDHEKKLQIWEILYMLKIDSFWIRKQVWIVSSFNLSGAFFRYHMLLLKAILLIVSIFVRSDFVLQSTLFFCIILFFGTYYCLIHAPFRTFSSNMVLWTVCAAWIFNSAFAMVNAYGVTSAVTVASTQAYLLLVFNILACIVVLSITIYSAFFLSVLDWPTLRTFRRIQNSKTLFPAVSNWVDAIRESNVLQLEYLAAPPEVADLPALEECIRRLRKDWLSARSIGSLFESVLGDRLEELLLLHTKTLPLALRRFPHWDRAYMQAVDRQAFRQRRERYAAMNPKKRRILMKLLAYRHLCLVGMSGGSKLHAKRFDFMLAVKHSQMLKDYEAVQEKLKQLKLDKERNLLNAKKFTLPLLGLAVSSGGMGYQPVNVQDDDDNNDEGAANAGSGGGGGNGDLSAYLTAEEQKLLRLFDPTAADAPHHEGGWDANGGNYSGDGLADANSDPAALGLHSSSSSSLPLLPHHQSQNLPDQWALAAETAGSVGVFSRQELQEAAEMLVTLKARTESSLTKHHIASVNLKQWGGGGAAGSGGAASPQQAAEVTSSDGLLTSPHDSDRFTSFRVLKETVDQEEREELQELYLLWDEAIHLYEAEEFPGDYDKLNVDVENWYTYRSILSERLELVLQLLAEKQFFDFNQIEAVEVIEEDDDEKEDDEDDDSGGGNGRRETGEEEVRKEVDDEDDDEEEEDYDDADVENQLRAKYQQSKMMPLLQSLPPANPSPLLPVADAASSGPAQALARSKSGNTGFEYADVFDSTGSEDVVGNANDMLRFNK